MPDYLGLPDFEHGSAQRLGVLLVNLGTPDAPTAAAVRRFLAQFLWDPRVIETPRWLWWLILHGVILRIRPRRSARAYQQIWTAEGSPLLRYSRELTARVQTAVSERLNCDVMVALGMSYGSPSLIATLESMYRSGVRRIVVLPLYPQYSATTTASVFDRVTRTLQRFRWLPEFRFITHYHDDDTYISALAASIQLHWRTHPRQHLLFSFHGVPRSYLLAGDPYYCQCMKTARLVSERLRLADTDWSVSFQSQVGRAEWLRPYTDDVLIERAKNVGAGITVVCPGFATDCLETLEEIDIRNRALFLERGGVSYDYVPALNASDAHVTLLAQLIERHTQGWAPSASAEAAVTAETRNRALRRGAHC
jgi:ferrochelatase